MCLGTRGIQWQTSGCEDIFRLRGSTKVALMTLHGQP